MVVAIAELAVRAVAIALGPLDARHVRTVDTPTISTARSEVNELIRAVNAAVALVGARARSRPTAGGADARG